MRKVAPVLLAVLVLSSCSHDEPTAAPPTSPAATSASASVDPAKDPLYLEAVGVYRKYFAEMAKFEAEGYPSDTLPPVMDRYITGGMKSAISNAIVESRRQHLAPARGYSSVLSAVAPIVGARREDSLVGIRVCADGRGGEVIDTKSGKSVGVGALAYKEIWFKRFDGVLKAYLSDSQEVEKCPI